MDLKQGSKHRTNYAYPCFLQDKQNCQGCVIFLAKCEQWRVCELAAGGAKVPHCKDPNHAKVTALLHIIITSLSFPPRLAPSLSGRSSCKQKVMEEQEEDSCHYVATVNFCYGLRLLNTQKLPQQLLQLSRQKVTCSGTGVVAVRP